MEWIHLIIILAGLVFIAWLSFPIILELRKKYQVKSFTNTDEEAINLLKQDIDKAKQSIYLVGGVAFPKVYNNADVVEALRGAHKRKIDIKMIFGPTIYEDKTGNRILDLADEGTIELFKFPKIPQHHFRIIDNQIVI